MRPTQAAPTWQGTRWTSRQSGLAARIVEAKPSRLGEQRYKALGRLDGRVVIVTFSRLGSEAYSLISLRPASVKERRQLLSSRKTADEEARRDVARGYTDADLEAVSDSPEWTAEDTARAKSFAEMFPEDAAALEHSVKHARGKQKAPTKQQVSLRLDRDVVERFKASGRGWQVRMGEALRKTVGL